MGVAPLFYPDNCSSRQSLTLTASTWRVSLTNFSARQTGCSTNPLMLTRLAEAHAHTCTGEHPCHGHPSLQWGSYGEMLRAGVEGILNVSLADEQWTHFSLPIRMGDMGSEGCTR